jgi:S1-C subfamily serine protease
MTCWVLCALTILGPGAGPPSTQKKHDARVPSDDQTFRPTVIVRKGNSQGSGSVIASVDGETLVLTVAHVVKNPGDLTVEVHRYNVGLEHTPSPWKWPRVQAAEVLVIDVPADLAIVRVRRMHALPYVARLSSLDDPIAPGTVVTSIGIDRAEKLSSWSAHLVGTASMDLKQTGVKSRCFVTDRAPEHGRSGGGLFLLDGSLVGVCIGRIDRRDGDAIGVFASLENIRRLVREQRLEETIQISEKHHVAERRSDPNRRRPVVTPTESRHNDAPR